MTEQIIFRRQTMQIGNSTGITLPQEILEYLQIKIGDTITITTNNKQQAILQKQK